MYLHFMKFVEVDIKAVLMRDVLIRVPWVLIAQVQSYVSTFRDCMRDILSLMSSPSPSNAWEKQLTPAPGASPKIQKTCSPRETVAPLCRRGIAPASHDVMEGSVPVKAVTAFPQPACSRGPAAEGISPIGALASNNRMRLLRGGRRQRAEAQEYAHSLEAYRFKDRHQRGPAAGGESPT